MKATLAQWAVKLDPSSTRELPASPSIADLLRLLARHSGRGQDEELEKIIARYAFMGAADLSVLFELATHIDDGHGLTVIKYVGCRHRNDPESPEFDDASLFLSREFQLSRTSMNVRGLNAQLRQALLDADAHQAAGLIMRETERLLDGIRDARLRQRIGERIAYQLTALQF